MMMAICYISLKREAKDRDGWRHTERMSKTWSATEDNQWWWWLQV